MFNTNTNIKMGSTTQNVQFNTPSTGMMQRSHPKSIFIRCTMGSDVEKLLFPPNGDDPKILVRTDKKYPHEDWRGNKDWNRPEINQIFEEVQVLQTLIFGDNIFLIEVVKVKDLVNNEEK